jgi:hypothetical protein
MHTLNVDPTMSDTSSWTEFPSDMCFFQVANYLPKYVDSERNVLWFDLGDDETPAVVRWCFDEGWSLHSSMPSAASETGETHWSNLLWSEWWTLKGQDTIREDEEEELLGKALHIISAWASVWDWAPEGVLARTGNLGAMTLPTALFYLAIKEVSPMLVCNGGPLVTYPQISRGPKKLENFCLWNDYFVAHSGDFGTCARRALTVLKQAATTQPFGVAQPMWEKQLGVPATPPSHLAKEATDLAKKLEEWQADAEDDFGYSTLQSADGILTGLNCLVMRMKCDRLEGAAAQIEKHIGSLAGAIGDLSEALGEPEEPLAPTGDEVMDTLSPIFGITNHSKAWSQLNAVVHLLKPLLLAATNGDSSTERAGPDETQGTTEPVWDRFDVQADPPTFDGARLEVGSGYEHEVLEKLIQAEGSLLTFEQLDDMGNNPSVASQRLKKAVSNLNKNLLPNLPVTLKIENRRGKGYYIQAD